VPCQVGREDAAEVLFRRTGRRPVVVGQVEMRDPQVEGSADDSPLALEWRLAAEVLPEAQ